MFQSTTVSLPNIASDCTRVIRTYSSWRSNCSTLRAVNLNSNLFNTEDGLKPICRKAVQKSQKKYFYGSGPTPYISGSYDHFLIGCSSKPLGTLKLILSYIWLRPVFKELIKKCGPVREEKNDKGPQNKDMSVSLTLLLLKIIHYTAKIASHSV